MPKCVLITGCSGGGKSTLLSALAAQGYTTVPEPGRRIVQSEFASGGQALPWQDPVSFSRKAVELALSDLESVPDNAGTVFFDRGLIDALTALEHHSGTSVQHLWQATRSYERIVFVAPPWSEIFLQDEERRHTFEQASDEYQRILVKLLDHGFSAIELPKVPVPERVRFVIHELNQT
ncbi:MAG: AAA family ATPase [Pseudomonadota bacterium]